MSAAFALGGLADCGGQTGEGDWGPSRCVDQSARSLGEHERSPLGFAPAEVLEFTSQQSFRFMRADGSQLPATLILRAQPGGARFVSRQLSYALDIPDPCRGRVEQPVQVELSLTSANGELQLSASGILSAQSAYHAELRAELSPADFERLRDFELQPEESLGSMGLYALLTSAGSAGHLDGRVNYRVHVGPQPAPEGGAPRVRDYTTERSVSIGRWPAESECESGNLPLPLDRALFEISAQQVLRAFEVALPLAWRDGTSTTLTLEPTAVGGACLATARLPHGWQTLGYLLYEREESTLFGVPIELALHTSDGRFAGRAQTTLLYEPEITGGLSRAWLKFDVELPMGDAGGWTDVRMEPAKKWAWRLELVHEPGSAAAASGVLRLDEYGASPPCAAGRICLEPPGTWTARVWGAVE